MTESKRDDAATPESQIDALYREGAVEQPPQALDQQILQQARDNCRQAPEVIRPAPGFWQKHRYGLSAAASVMLVAGLFILNPELRNSSAPQLSAPANLEISPQADSAEDAAQPARLQPMTAKRAAPQEQAVQQQDMPPQESAVKNRAVAEDTVQQRVRMAPRQQQALAALPRDIDGRLDRLTSAIEVGELEQAAVLVRGIAADYQLTLPDTLAKALNPNESAQVEEAALQQLKQQSFIHQDTAPENAQVLNREQSERWQALLERLKQSLEVKENH
ncbi:hypothetical protein L2728_05085 [Shewanella chilikensis]|uniref:hypothetical protein n=1 Tax=Shewanella TaxID=22 RepID=UPI001ED3D196|nr:MULTISPECIES: hypothetical protein [Shewanella]MBZ4677893.1 hypothetical protein [Shewanella sp.]MCL1161260.1 hypothetical protein [Shewanella chilikensis]